MTVEPVRVGLVGAGPWASMFHGPVLAAGPHTAVAAVWSRRSEQSKALAEQLGTASVPTLEALWATCDVVVHCVPPDVQADLAVGAMERGLPTVLEKPVAADLAGAERLAATAAKLQARTLVVLTWRFSQEVTSFLSDAAARTWLGGRATFVSPALLDSPFRTPWRVRSGPLLDLGPHVIDALDAALGPVSAVVARGEQERWVALTLEHSTGATSQAVVSGHVGGTPVANLELFGTESRQTLDVGAHLGPGAAAAFSQAVADLGRGRPDPGPNLQRGLEIQQILELATDQLN